jgi:protein-S-isoprenylcysteine O-methyltransferase Ste14
LSGKFRKNIFCLSRKGFFNKLSFYEFHSKGNATLNPFLLRYMWRVGLSLFLGALLLLLLSGRLDWLWGWVYIILTLTNQSFALFYLQKKNPELLKERTRIKPDAKAWDKPYVTIQGVLGPFAILIVSGLDERLGWSAIAPVLHILGLALCMLGAAWALWAGLANPYFSAVVRIQKDRGHVVISGGPYRFMRHPGYAGGILFILAIPLMLGSLWAHLPAFLTSLVVVFRTSREDRTLQEELEGYRDYSRRVRFRLIPGIW